MSDLIKSLELVQVRLFGCVHFWNGRGLNSLQFGLDVKLKSDFFQMGACHTGRLAVVSSAFPHFGEESVLQGWNGSGTIFFGMCNLRCVFCQNWDIRSAANKVHSDFNF